ncbi:MAG: aminotransferase class I/II-fold pyridoxal phosphate-dependent enzyme [Pseudonocardiaceae bacterium]|nr:aminotransferase class I/II-fold pyridoxal phosphate-dependent enzyme [Pseudonocardiaceae bacterium]
MAHPNPAGRISGSRLAALLGTWRSRPARSSAADLAAAVRLLVLDGQLPPGTRLPSERELATATRTSRTLATAAYDRLRDEGLLASRRGAGSWTALPGAVRAAGDALLPNCEPLLDLAHAAPSAPPGLAAAAEAVRPAFAAQLAEHGYHPQGLLELRRRIADRFAGRGLPTSPDQILVTHGAQHALALVLRSVTSPGDRVLVEHPTYPNALEAIRAVHARPVPVRLDRTGWDVEALDAALRRSVPALAYLIPDFQHPTGLAMSAGTRREIGSLLRRSRTPVVIDETLVELDLDGGATAPPLAEAAGDLAITIGSASKSFWGGLRMGWLRAPAELVSRLVAARPATDLGCPVFEQLLLGELLDGADVLLADRLAELRNRRAALLDALGEHCPSWTVREPRGGLSLWCELDAAGSSRLAVLGAQHGLRVTPGSRFSAHGGLERRLRLPYTLPTEVLPGAVARLAMAWAAVGAAPGGDAVQLATDAALA